MAKTTIAARPAKQGGPAEQAASTLCQGRGTPATAPAHTAPAHLCVVVCIGLKADRVAAPTESVAGEVLERPLDFAGPVGPGKPYRCRRIAQGMHHNTKAAGKIRQPGACAPACPSCPAIVPSSLLQDRPACWTQFMQSSSSSNTGRCALSLRLNTPAVLGALLGR